MPLVFNMPGFSIYQSSEYARVTQGSEYAWIVPEYVWLYLDMSEMPEYAGIFLDMPQFVSLYIVFVLS